MRNTIWTQKKQQCRSVDKRGHGEGAWKVCDESGVWLAAADICGGRMSKHKSGVGKNINFRSLKCKDEK